MFGDLFTGAKLPVGEFWMLMYVSPPADNLLFNGRHALGDALIELGGVTPRKNGEQSD